MPAATGEYRLALTTANGAPLAGDTVRLPVRVVADSAPAVEIPVPGADTIAPLSLQVPLVVDARDDHGITGVAVESRRISRLGVRDSARRDTLATPRGADRSRHSHPYARPQPPGAPARRHRPLLRGGDRQHAATTDRPFARVRAAAAHDERGAGGPAGRVAGRGYAAGLHHGGKPAARAADGRSRPRARPHRLFGRTRRGGAVLRALQAGGGGRQGTAGALPAGGGAEAVAGGAAQERGGGRRGRLGLAAPAAGDPRAARSRALARAARAAGRAAAGAQGSRRRAGQERRSSAWPRRSGRCARRWSEAGSCSAARRWRAISPTWRRSQASSPASSRNGTSRCGPPTARGRRRRSGSSPRAPTRSRQGLERLGQQMETEARQQRLDSAASQAGRASKQMSQAAQSAQQGQREPAKSQGEDAARSLEPLGDQLQQERQAMQQEWREEVMQAIDQALAETSRLAERQLAVQEQLEQRRRRRVPRSGRSRAPSKKACSGCWSRSGRRRARTPWCRRRSGPRSAARSARCSGRARRSRSATPNAREGAEQAGGAVDALNAAAYQLLRARGDVSGRGLGLGSRRGDGADGAAGQAAGRARPAGRGPAADGGIGGESSEQLRQLGPSASGPWPRSCRGCRARATCPAPERWPTRPRSWPGGSRRGRLDRQMVERQERLFRRMLDAGRTLQGTRGRRAQGAPEHHGDRRQRAPAAGAPRQAHGRRRPSAGPELGGAAAALAGGAAAGGGLLPPPVGVRRHEAGMASASALASSHSWCVAAAPPAPSAQQTRPCRAPSSSSGGATTRRRPTLSQRARREAGGSRRAAGPRARRCCRSNRSAEILPEVRAALATDPDERRPLRRGAAGLGRRGSARQHPRRRGALGRGRRRATRRRTASGARPPSRGATGARPRSRPTGGREQLGRPDALAAELAQLADRRRRLRQARSASGCRRSGASRATASRPWPRWPGARLDARRAPARSCSAEPDFPARRLEADLRARWGDPLGGSRRAARRAAGRSRAQALEALARLARPAPHRSAGRDARLAQGRALELIAERQPRTRSARASGSTRRRPTPPPASATPRAGCSTGIADDRSAPGAISAGAAATLVTVLIGEGKLDEAAPRLAEHRADMSGEEYADAPATAGAGLRPGGRARPRRRRARRATARWTDSRCAGGSGCTGATRRARSSASRRPGRTPATGPRPPSAPRCSRCSSRSRPTASRRSARRSSQLEQGDTAAGRRGPRAGRRRACRRRKGGAEVRLLAGRLAARDREARRRRAAAPGRRGARGAGHGARPPSSRWRSCCSTSSGPRTAIAQLEHLILTYPASALVPQARRLLDQARGRGARRHEAARLSRAGAGAGLAGAVARRSGGFRWPAARRPGSWSRWTTRRRTTSRPTASRSGCWSAAGGRSGSSTTGAASFLLPADAATARDAALDGHHDRAARRRPRWSRSGARSRAATWTRCRWRRRPRWRSTRRPTPRRGTTR